MIWLGLVNGIIKALGAILGVIISVLPSSPFKALFSLGVMQKYIANINWIVPVNAMVTTAGLWISGIAVYYIYRGVLKLINMVS